MFMGEFSHTMDAKGRLIIPAKLREGLGDGCVVTRGVDKCLTVYTKEGFERLAQSLQEAAKLDATRARNLNRYLFGNASPLEFDKQGRVLIPAILREYAGMAKEAVIVGANDRVEIWSREQWDAFGTAVEEDIEELAKNGIPGFTF